MINNFFPTITLITMVAHNYERHLNWDKDLSKQFQFRQGKLGIFFFTPFPLWAKQVRFWMLRFNVKWRSTEKLLWMGIFPTWKLPPLAAKEHEAISSLQPNSLNPHHTLLSSSIFLYSPHFHSFNTQNAIHFKCCKPYRISSSFLGRPNFGYSPILMIVCKAEVG